MSHGLWHGCSGSAGVRVVWADVYVCVCESVSACRVGCGGSDMPSWPCLHLRRGPEKQDLIWRVPWPLFPTICMLHCQERGGAQRGELMIMYVCACQQGSPPVNFTLFWLPWHNVLQYSDPPTLTRTHTPSYRIFFILQRFRTSTRASYFVNGAYLPFHQCPQSFSPPEGPHPCLSFPSPMFFTLIAALPRIKTPPASPPPSSNRCHANVLFSCCLPRMRSGEPLQDILQQLKGDPDDLVRWSNSHDLIFSKGKHTYAAHALICLSSVQVPFTGMVELSWFSFPFFISFFFFYMTWTISSTICLQKGNGGSVRFHNLQARFRWV